MSTQREFTVAATAIRPLQYAIQSTVVSKLYDVNRVAATGRTQRSHTVQFELAKKQQLLTHLHLCLLAADFLQLALSLLQLMTRISSLARCPAAAAPSSNM
jgi:hypothetical protein